MPLNKETETTIFFAFLYIYQKYSPFAILDWHDIIRECKTNSHSNIHNTYSRLISSNPLCPEFSLPMFTSNTCGNFT